MTDFLIARTSLFGLEAIAFCVLSFVLFMFYRGFGRQYVQLWSYAFVYLVVYLVCLSLQEFTVLTPEIQVSQIVLEWVKQTSFYTFWLLIFLGTYAAKARIVFSRKFLLSSISIALALATLTSWIFAFDVEHAFDRYFLRETLSSFVIGCSLLTGSVMLFANKPHHFSSRILMYTSGVIGIRYLLFSFISILAINESWFNLLSTLLTHFDSASRMVLGFCLLVWLQGAERNAAVHAISKAQYLGKHDQLTGSLNREQVIEKMPVLMAQAAENNSSLGIFLIDIKRFKFINDTYGLKTGDFLLGEIASRLKQSIFKPGIVGRLSGDSFVYVLPFKNTQQVEHVADHIHELISLPYHFAEQEISLQCSLGYSFYPEHADQAEDLLQFANLALFHAESRNELSKQFSHDMQVQGRHLLAMEKEIKSGLANDEFELYFQPQLNLLTNRLEGVEALVRWNHPERGFLTPNHFLEDVDALAINSQFDNYVLEKSCQAINHWYKSFKRRVAVAVNITAVEFQDPKLVSRIQKLLQKYDIPPIYLELEITENVVMTDLDSAMNTIVMLQNMGIKVSIDDFGTGYSSLAYLRQLPIDKIKIDRSFIGEMAENDSDLTIVKSMIKLSHGLGKRVLAEGVETNTQLEMLRTLGCDAVQGYFISKPVSLNEIANYLIKK